MCGICGLVDYSSPPDAAVLKRMSQSILHRGPDEDGYILDDQAGLASRRLSIIDLATGRQPIPNEDHSKWIVFNGEIYNYRELFGYLQRRGHVFRTQADTEVILHLYEEFGAGCLERLDGIFAFAIWDTQKSEIFLGRDRMGIKPLYYAQPSPSRLVFGSEMKAILAYPGLPRDLDLDALNEYLAYEYVPTPRTILRGVRRLEPGHYLRFSQAGLHKAAYHRLSFQSSESSPVRDWRGAAQALRTVLRGAVQRELVSDVPVGVLLSGGVDSSSVAALMAELYPGKVQSFTIGFAEKSFDEAPYARQVARHLGLEHNELVLTEKMSLDLLECIPQVLDEPFADSSFIPTFLLSQFASRQVKVVLGGDGGDELFAGYPTLLSHRLMGIYERWMPPGLHRLVQRQVLPRVGVSFDNISFDFRLRRFLDGYGRPLLARHHRWLGSFVEEEKAELFQPWVTSVQGSAYQPSFDLLAGADARQPFNQVLHDDLRMYLEGDILYKVDRASMASSLEVRVPILNREVVQFALDLPFDLKLRGLTGKFLLKKSMEQDLPHNILYRPKKGFNMPVAYWLSGALKPLLTDMLSPARLQKQGLFEPRTVEALMDDHFAHRRDNRKLLWTLLMFQMWQHSYLSHS